VDKSVTVCSTETDSSEILACSPLHITKLPSDVDKAITSPEAESTVSKNGLLRRVLLTSEAIASV